MTFDITPKDIIIAVMGVTGVGKSTFINLFTQEEVIVGKTLESCTQDVRLYQCRLPQLPPFYLVDTPGFDDSSRSDGDILRELASWLAQAYASEIKLAGIIYFHRILDVKFGGAAMRNLRMFKQLCGRDNLGSVVLATTFWRNVPADSARLREWELSTKPELWGGLISQGSKMFRQDNDAASGAVILKYLIERRRRVVLEIQREMVDQQKPLAETAAGAEVQAELAGMKRMYEQQIADLRKDMQEALAQRDREWQAEVAGQRHQLEERIRVDEEARRKMRAKYDDLWKQREVEREEERKKLLDDAMRAQRETHKLEIELLQAQSEAEKRDLRSRLEIEKWKRRAHNNRLVYRDAPRSSSSCLVM